MEVGWVGGGGGSGRKRRGELWASNLNDAGGQTQYTEVVKHSQNTLSSDNNRATSSSLNQQSFA